MPYIPQERRHLLNDTSNKPITSGELNYVISQQVRSYIAMRGPSYSTFNDIVGVLECLKLEVYRRIVAPYEQKKLEVNGDVFL